MESSTDSHLTLCKLAHDWLIIAAKASMGGASHPLFEPRQKKPRAIIWMWDSAKCKYFKNTFMAAKDFFKIAYSSTIKYFSCNCHCTLNYICLLLLSWKNWDIWDEGAYIVTVSVLMSDTFYVDEWQFLCRRVTISVLKWVKVSVLMSDCFFVEDWQFLCQWVIVSVSLSDCFCIIEWQFLCWWVTVSLSLSDSFCVYAWHCSFFFLFTAVGDLHGEERDGGDGETDPRDGAGWAVEEVQTC